LRVGDKVPDSADWSVYYDVVEVEAPSHEVLHSTRHVLKPVTASDFSWAFVLRPLAGGRTRAAGHQGARGAPLSRGRARARRRPVAPSVISFAS